MQKVWPPEQNEQGKTNRRGLQGGRPSWVPPTSWLGKGCQKGHTDDAHFGELPLAVVWTVVCQGTGAQADGSERSGWPLGQRQWLGLRGDMSQHRTQVEVTVTGPATGIDVREEGLDQHSSSIWLAIQVGGDSADGDGGLGRGWGRDAGVVTKSC